MTLDILCNNIKEYIDERIESLTKRRAVALEISIKKIKIDMRTLGEPNYEPTEFEAYDKRMREIDEEIKKLKRIRKIFEEETEDDSRSQEGESLR